MNALTAWQKNFNSIYFSSFMRQVHKREQKKKTEQKKSFLMKLFFFIRLASFLMNVSSLSSQEQSKHRASLFFLRLGFVVFSFSLFYSFCLCLSFKSRDTIQCVAQLCASKSVFNWIFRQTSFLSSLNVQHREFICRVHSISWRCFFFFRCIYLGFFFYFDCTVLCVRFTSSLMAACNDVIGFSIFSVCTVFFIVYFSLSSSYIFRHRWYLLENGQTKNVFHMIVHYACKKQTH